MEVEVDPFNQFENINKKRAINYNLETEECLGPLPQHWEMSLAEDGRSYYVDHIAKETTWIDPRTRRLRKSDVKDVEIGELPYGWDELWSVKVGWYYLDHNTQTSFLEPPWSDAIQNRLMAEQENIKNDMILLEEKIKLEEEKRQQLMGQEIKIDTLEKKRMTLEKSLQSLQKQKDSLVMKEDDTVKEANASQDSMEEEMEKIRKLESLKEEVEKTTQEIDEAKHDINVEKAVGETIAQEHALLLNDLKELRVRIKELQELNANLSLENSTQQQISDSAQDEMEVLRSMLDKELQQFKELELHVGKLKKEIIDMVVPDESKGQNGSIAPIAEEKPSSPSKIEPVIAGNIVDKLEDVESGSDLEEHVLEARAESFARLSPSLQDSTGNYGENKEKMLQELDKLKVKLEIARKDKELLQELSNKMENEKTTIQNQNIKEIPKWIDEMDIDSQLRIISQQLSGKTEVSEAKTFQEKRMLFEMQAKLSSQKEKESKVRGNKS